MGSLEGGSSDSPSHVSGSVQAFEVFRDTSQGNSLPEPSRSTDEEAHGIQAEHLSSSAYSVVTNNLSKLSGQGSSHNRPNDGLASPAKRHAKLSPHPRSPTSPDTTRGRVLAQNSLKVNLSPREVSNKHVHIVMSAKPSAGQKRGLPQEDRDIEQHPRKSLRSASSTLKSSKDFSKEADSEDEAAKKAEEEVTKEPPVSGIPVSIVSSPKEIINDSAANEEFFEAASPEPMIEAFTTPTEQLAEKTFTAFHGGDPTTPRSSAMYAFNSTIRMLNPFKAVGNLLGRLSATHSPSRPQHETLSSNEIAKQVDDHLQRFEDRMFDRLLAFQTANQSSSLDAHGTRSQPTALLSSPIGLESEALGSQDLSEQVVSPLQELDKYISTNPTSSPLPPMSQFRKITLHPADLRLAGRGQQTTLRSSFAAFLKSPTIGRSKREVETRTTSDHKASFALSNLFSSPAAKADSDKTQISRSAAAGQTFENEDHDVDTLMQNDKDALAGVNSSPPRGADNTNTTATEINHELPRLRNKASQHLKKMASRMNLRGRKSTTNNTMSNDNDEYRIMKKKNKDQLLKDYLVLQREKQELEKQLATRNEETRKDDDTVQVDDSETVSSWKQAQERKTIDLLPVLLDSKIPDLRVRRKRSKSPDWQDAEYDRVKRRTLVAPADLFMTSPLSPINNENAANTCQPISEHVETAPQRFSKNSNETGESALEEKANGTQASLAIGKVPPVPTVPSKYRSKVPQPTRARGATRKRKAIEENWDGWDAEVF